MYDVVMLPSADRQLEEAVMYITTELCAPDAALHLLDEVAKAISTLKEMPYRYPVYPMLYERDYHLHYFPVMNYVIHYVVKEDIKTVEIWYVVHQRRNMKRG